MKNTFLFLLLVLPILPSCGGSQHGENAQIQLDKGNRWQANPETTSGIANMQAIVSKYGNTTKSPDDRKTLRTELETEFQNIFKQCTMKGEAHDQLHNYLLPMKGIFEKIGDGTSKESAAAISQLEKHLAEYQIYFK